MLYAIIAVAGPKRHKFSKTRENSHEASLRGEGRRAHAGAPPKPRGTPRKARSLSRGSTRTEPEVCSSASPPPPPFSNPNKRPVPGNPIFSWKLQQPPTCQSTSRDRQSRAPRHLLALPVTAVLPRPRDSGLTTSPAAVKAPGPGLRSAAPWEGRRARRSGSSGRGLAERRGLAEWRVLGAGSALEPGPRSSRVARAGRRSLAPARTAARYPAKGRSRTPGSAWAGCPRWVRISERGSPFSPRFRPRALVPAQRPPDTCFYFPREEPRPAGSRMAHAIMCMHRRPREGAGGAGAESAGGRRRRTNAGRAVTKRKRSPEPTAPRAPASPHTRSALDTCPWLSLLAPSWPQ